MAVATGAQDRGRKFVKDMMPTRRDFEFFGHRILHHLVSGDLWANAFYLDNQTSDNNWIHIDLEGTTSNRDGFGTKITVKAGDLTLKKEKRNGVGFGSSDSPTVEFGLGQESTVDRLRIWWPSGLEQTFENIPINQWIHIREGESRTESMHGGDTSSP